MDKPAGGPFTPVKQGNLTELVVSQIKNLIFPKGIDVGQKFPPERDLAGQLNISRSAVREALRSLENNSRFHVALAELSGNHLRD